MNKKLDLLIVNSLAPRQRCGSDAALENSLAILRTYLEYRGISVQIFDEQRVSSPEAGVPQWCLKLLRILVSLQLKTYNSRRNYLWIISMLAAWPIQELLLRYRSQYINSKIDNIITIIKENGISLLGIKVWYGDSFKWSKLLADKVRETCPEVSVIVGGPQVNVYGELVLHDTAFDIAIMGHGGELLEKIVLLRRKTSNRREFLAKFHSEASQSRLVKTGGYKEGGQQKQITIPRYRSDDLRDKILFHTIVDGFGCTWNKCNFCSHTRQVGAYQFRPVQEIITELQQMTRQGISFFRFSSSETSPLYGKKIAQAIMDNGLNINYSMFARSIQVTPEIYRSYCLMIKSGLRAVFMGGETGHDIINQQIMNKGTCRANIIDTINNIRLAAAEVGENCRIGLALIYPCPVVDGVTLEDVYNQNIALIRETMPDSVVVSPPGVIPGTKWFEQPEKFGFKIGDDFARVIMQYEYSMYKPPELWTKLDFSLQNRDFLALLKETGKLRKAIADMGIPTDISDEYLMMTEAIGYKSKADLMRFKSESLLDIVSGSSCYMKEVVEKINERSRAMAFAPCDTVSDKKVIS